MKFVDELTIYAKAGDGGGGVVRWRHEKFRPQAGPAGGNGGNGGDVYVRAIRNLNQLAKYTGVKAFVAENGAPGRYSSQHGKGSGDLYIDVPVGATVHDTKRGEAYYLEKEGQCQKILRGGKGGLGNEHFKSSTNRAPQEHTKGQAGEEGEFSIELSLIVDIGLVGLPNAGKSSLLNALTNAASQVGAYEFTTLEPHLGDLYGYTIADIPGLISGAAIGKGLGLQFLRHVERTKMLLHLVSLEHTEPKNAYETVRAELSAFKKELSDKEEWIILTKKDLISQREIDDALQSIDKNKKRVFVISTNTGEGVKELQDSLVERLRQG